MLYLLKFSTFFSHPFFSRIDFHPLHPLVRDVRSHLATEYKTQGIDLRFGARCAREKERGGGGGRGGEGERVRVRACVRDRKGRRGRRPAPRRQVFACVRERVREMLRERASEREWVMGAGGTEGRRDGGTEGGMKERRKRERKGEARRDGEIVRV
jgi:hypothetical protein